MPGSPALPAASMRHPSSASRSFVLGCACGRSTMTPAPGRRTQTRGRTGTKRKPSNLDAGAATDKLRSFRLRRSFALDLDGDAPHVSRPAFHWRVASLDEPGFNELAKGSLGLRFHQDGPDLVQPDLTLVGTSKSDVTGPAVPTVGIQTRCALRPIARSTASCKPLNDDPKTKGLVRWKACDAFDC